MVSKHDFLRHSIIDISSSACVFLQALIEVQNASDMKSQVRELTFVQARELEVGGKKCILIYVPVPQLKLYRPVQVRSSVWKIFPTIPLSYVSLNTF